MDTFSNHSIHPDNLPQAALVEGNAVDPRLAKLMQAPLLPLMVAVPVAVLLFTRNALALSWLQALPWSLLALVLVLAMGRYRWLWARRFRYALREHDTMIWFGLWWRHHKVVPNCRLQHLAIEQGPLERYFGLSTLKGYSAGSASAELRIPGLTPQQAQALRQQLLLKVES
ncbi:PH domain-containing protein [Gallaecimonas sp. GXIMD4217]|uniref:PH domain-containing protein n=1 Tax=Gallaecimonas sp. GXIMD4217 TaxID=3131927 RepID=UPI00311B20DF